MIIGFIISYIHPSTATTLFKTFDCYTINNLPDAAGESWLNMDVSEMCFTGSYFGHAVWVVIMIIFFVFGFPMFIAFSLWYMSQVWSTSTRSFSHSFSLMIRSVSLMIRSVSLMIRSFSLMIRSFSLMIRSVSLQNRLS